MQINNKAIGGTVGAGTGFGAGKVITNVLVSFGIIDADQGASVADLIEFLSVLGFSFLGAYLPRSNT